MFTRQNNYYIIDWVRFIDDIILNWKGSKDCLRAFIEYLNGMVSLINFTHKISCSSVNFLDTKVMKEFDG